MKVLAKILCFCALGYGAILIMFYGLALIIPAPTAETREGFTNNETLDK